MQPYINNVNLDVNMVDFRKREQVIATLKKRFSSYGYKQIQTPPFETYDLYSSVIGTINQHDMIKVVDQTGQVLVLRPDITIPITQQVAKASNSLSEELRYFYVLDVYRHTTGSIANYNNTQAGVEFFGNNKPEADAEVIALAAHTLQDLQIHKFTIEIGHAGFFKEILDLLLLSKAEIKKFKQLIQAKNISGLTEFLFELNIDQSLQRTIMKIPFLYGKPMDVIKQAKQLTLTDRMRDKVEALEQIYRTLTAYQVENNIVLDLGLINHMEYYSDVIFQGYIEQIAKPVLSGGRYDKLAEQFHASIPAIGFAFDIDELVINGQDTGTQEIDFPIYYDPSKTEDAIQTAQWLRNNSYTAIMHSTQGKNTFIPGINGLISMEPLENTLIIKDKTYSFVNMKELNLLLNEYKGRD